MDVQRIKIPLMLTAVLLAVFLSFRPVLHSDFVNWDDDVYVLNNPLVHALNWDNVTKIFQTTTENIYSPLVILSFAVEHHFLGFHPFIYHLDNLLLHLAIVALIFRFSLLLGLGPTAAAFASLLFGLHPLHVESVAWITERKDVLYTFFYMLALNSYLRYIDDGKGKDFFFAVLYGLLSILSKPMALSLPLVFFLCDWFKGRRFDVRCLAEKLILFLYIIPGVLMSLNRLYVSFPFHFFEEALKVMWTFIFYLQKFFFPLSLGMFYEWPTEVTLFNPSYAIAAAAVIVLVASLIIFRKNKIFIFANAFYLFSIFFVLRIVIAYSPGGPPFYAIEDRRMYLPSLGYCLWMGFILSQISRSFKGRVLNALVLGLLSFLTFLQCLKWENNFTLWSSVIQHNPYVATAYNNRAVGEKNKVRALDDYNKAIALDPHFAEAYFNRARIYTRLEKYDEAIRDYTRCLELDPGDTVSFKLRARLYGLKDEQNP